MSGYAVRAMKPWQVKAVAAMLVVVCAMPVGLYHYYQYRQLREYRAIVTDAGAVTDVVFIGARSGLMSVRCGTAVFRLAPAAKGARAARYPTSAGWTPTPYVPAGVTMEVQDLWMLGLDCAGLNNALVRQIDSALEKPGSYVKRGDEDTLVVMPALNLVALVYYR